MAQSPPALVEPSVLRWARESINLTPLAAARRIKVQDGRVEEWEAGRVPPTIAQLRNAARVYKRPLGVFFLPEPPTTFDAMRDSAGTREQRPATGLRNSTASTGARWCSGKTPSSSLTSKTPNLRPLGGCSSCPTTTRT